MKKQKILCLVIDQDAEITAWLDAILRQVDTPLDVRHVASRDKMPPLLAEKKPHLLFCPRQKIDDDQPAALLASLQRHSADTLLVWMARDDWQGLTTWLLGVESCTLPIQDEAYFSQYLDFLLSYVRVKSRFRQCKQLLGISEKRSHWLVEHSHEPLAYIAQGMHLYANDIYVSLFGFESLAETHSTPVAQLIHPEEQKMFAAMCGRVESSLKPSERLLLTFHGLGQAAFRAEASFAPAVFQDKRCVQLHVHLLKKLPETAKPKIRKVNPWNGQAAGVAQAASIRQASANAQAAQRKPVGKVGYAPSGLVEVFKPSMKLSANAPELYFAEPELRQSGSSRLIYPLLCRQLDNPESRFKLDYWNVAQAIKKLSAQASNQPGYLVFVSMGASILNNEMLLKRLSDLLKERPKAARRLVISLDYRDCVRYVIQLGNTVRWLKVAGVKFGIDALGDESQVVDFIKAAHPDFVCIHPALAGKAARSTEAFTRLQKLVRRLADIPTRVIVSGVNEVGALNLLCATSASYLQGNILK